MSTLLLKLGEMRIPLRAGETLLGRSPNCSIVLADPRVSREHAAVRVNDEGASVEYLGSRNGTRVNGRKLTKPTALQPGDVLQLGRQRIEIELATPRSSAQSASATIEPALELEAEQTPLAPRPLERTLAGDRPSGG